jgi:hypothetical protein
MRETSSHFRGDPLKHFKDDAHAFRLHYWSLMNIRPDASVQDTGNVRFTGLCAPVTGANLVTGVVSFIKDL